MGNIGKDLKKDWWKLLILILYAVLVAIAIMRHEPFSDEGQAWLLARDAGPFAVLFKYLHYEGHPGLWFLLLMPFAKLHLPYQTINIISGIIGFVSIYLFLRYSPFPTIIKVLFPFTYFVFYQYAVIGRNYVLATPLLFLAAIMYRRKTEHPYLYILVLSLLANVSLHCTLIAIGFVIVNALDLRKKWRSLSKQLKKNTLVANAIFTAIVVLIVILLWPVPDNTLTKGFDFGIPRFVFTAKFLLISTSPITNYWPITLLVLLGSLAWFWKRKVFLLFVLPAFLDYLLISILPISVFNQGILFLLWFTVLWISFTTLGRRELFERSTAVLKHVAIASMIVVLAIQVVWGFNAFLSDLKYRYAGSYEVAEYIKENKLEKTKIYMVGSSSMGVLPYFNNNIFVNYNNGRKPSFWNYSTKNHTPQVFDDKAVESIMNNNPDIVVTSLGALQSEKNKQEQLGKLPNYGVIGPFLGRIAWKEHIWVEHAYSYFILYNKKRFYKY